MDQNIVFSFQGRHYSIAANATEFNKIVLPDRRVLQVGVWLIFEDQSPEPHDLHEVTTTQSRDLTLGQLAELVQGVLAELIQSE